MHRLLMAATLLLPLSVADAQSTAKATVIHQQGDVSIIKDNSNYRVALSLGDPVSAGQVITTGHDGYAQFQVPDGSTFEVFPDSRVVFRSTMSLGDLLNVVIGKVKVYIQHMGGIPNPNNVTTPTALISVRGTVFVVEVQDDEGTTTVAVDEGVVDVRNLKMGGQTVRLIPGQATTVNPRAPLLGLGGNKGGILYKVVKAAQDALYQGMPGIGGPRGGGGGTSAPSGGAQGDKGKPPTNGTGTPSGTGAPTGVGGAPAPPPPPPPGGGGGA